jgi:DNA-binding cell septation regulator SpoVG
MIKVLSIRKVVNPTTRAWIDIEYYGLVVRGLRIVEAKGQTFVAYPDEKGKDGKYYPTIFPATQTTKFELESLILNAYKEQK